MTDFKPSHRLLQNALLIDALASGATGVLLTAGSGFLVSILGLPRPLLLAAGVICLVWSVVLAVLARRERLERGTVWAVIGINSAWVIASIALLLPGWLAPTTLGLIFMIGQAVIVAGFVELQFIGLKRSALVTSSP
jgi:hypothetical protein